MLFLFALRKTIGQELKTEDAKTIETHAVHMDYNEWVSLLKNPELYILVKNSSAKIDPREALAKAESALSRKQSLFTMQAK